MSTTVAEMLVETLHRIGVRQIFGVVGDALNPLTEAIRKDQRIEWIGVRHEEGAALAAAGQAKLTGNLAVCCVTTGPVPTISSQACTRHAKIMHRCWRFPAVYRPAGAVLIICRKTSPTCSFATSLLIPRPSSTRRRRFRSYTRLSRRLTTSAAWRISAFLPT